MQGEVVVRGFGARCLAILLFVTLDEALGSFGLIGAQRYHTDGVVQRLQATYHVSSFINLRLVHHDEGTFVAQLTGLLHHQTGRLGSAAHEHDVRILSQQTAHASEEVRGLVVVHRVAGHDFAALGGPCLLDHGSPDLGVLVGRTAQSQLGAVVFQGVIGERVHVAVEGRRDTDGQRVTLGGDGRHTGIGHDEEVILNVEVHQCKDTARVRDEDGRNVGLLDQTLGVGRCLGRRILVVQGHDVDGIVLTVDVEATVLVDLVGRHAQAGQYVFTVQCGAARERAGEADVDFFRHGRGAHSHCGCYSNCQSKFLRCFHCFLLVLFRLRLSGVLSGLLYKRVSGV